MTPDLYEVSFFMGGRIARDVQGRSSAFAMAQQKALERNLPTIVHAIDPFGKTGDKVAHIGPNGEFEIYYRRERATT